jgi:DNA-binding SARP family transcriptional activator
MGGIAVLVRVGERVRQVPIRSDGVEASHATRLQLLNGFALSRNGREIVLPRSAQRVVAFLALTQRWLPRSQLAGTLWPETSEEHAAANLRSALWRLRRSGPNVVRSTRKHVGLEPGVMLDVRLMAAQGERLIDPHAECRPSDLDLDLLSDDLLPGWEEEWVAVEREALRQLRLHALEAMCRRLTAEGRYSEAIQAALAAAAGEPLRESAHIALIEAHLAEGNIGEAIRHYGSYRRILFDELGVDPSPAMKNLLDRFRLRNTAGTL